MSYFYPQTWIRKTDAPLSQTNPVSGTKYTILDTTRNCRIHSATASVTWTVQPTPLEIHVTIDGVLHTHAFANPASATAYSLAQSITSLNAAATSQELATTFSATVLLHPGYEGASIKVEAETTGGTTSNLSGRVKYSVLK